MGALADGAMGSSEENKKIQRRCGFSLGTEIDGAALISSHLPGYDLLVRLKDTRPLLLDEIQFWAKCLVELIPDREFDFVTHAPSSGKRPENEHLATLLSMGVSEYSGLQFCECFINEHPRGNRGSARIKLIERNENKFKYTGECKKSIVVIDDAIYTRSTALRCKEAAEEYGTSCFFVVLYRA